MDNIKMRPNTPEYSEFKNTGRRNNNNDDLQRKDEKKRAVILL